MKAKSPTETPEESVVKSKARFLKLLREQLANKTYNASTACQGIGYHRSTVYRWAEKDPEFDAEWRDIAEEFADLLEEKATARAIDGSDILMIFMLKSLRPEKFREQVKHELSGPSGGPIPFSYGDTVAEIAERPGTDSQS
jgi:hypothetical protein